jgi:AbrB family looped-hinge helix DNA binding protein
MAEENTIGSHMEMCLMIVGKVGRRGQMTVPKEIRRSLNLHEGDRIAFIRRGEEVILQPLTDTLLDLRGSVPVEGLQDFAAIRARVIQDHARKVAQDES